MVGLTVIFLLGVALWALTRPKTSAPISKKTRQTKIDTQSQVQDPPELIDASSDSEKTPELETSTRASTTQEWSPKAIATAVIAVIMFPVGIYYCFFHNRADNSKQKLDISFLKWPVILGGTALAGLYWRPWESGQPRAGTNNTGQRGNSNPNRKPAGHPTTRPPARTTRLTNAHRSHSGNPLDMVELAKRVKSYLIDNNDGGHLTMFGAYANGKLVRDKSKYKRDLVSSKHYDWWFFPTPKSGQRIDFRVSENSSAQQLFYRELLKDPVHMKNFKLACEIVSESWGWDVERQSHTQYKTNVNGIRWYKMCKCLALMKRYEQGSQYPWISKYYSSLMSLRRDNNVNGGIQGLGSKETDNLDQNFLGKYGTTYH